VATFQQLLSFQTGFFVRRAEGGVQRQALQAGTTMGACAQSSVLVLQAAVMLYDVGQPHLSIGWITLQCHD
jgi:hypothetical protein